MANPIINALSRVIAERDIHVTHVINVTRWLYLTYELSEKTQELQNEVLIRPATKENLALLASLKKEKLDTGYHIVDQMIRFWNDYGLRCMYVGHLKGVSTPFCWQYIIEDSDIDRLKNTDYGPMYLPLAPNAVYLEGGYIAYQLREKDLFTKFGRSRDKLLYQKGVRLLVCHIACNKSKIPVLKFCAKDHWNPDHWISMVTIRLPFFKTRVFVHHPIKNKDRGKFPLPLFAYGLS